MMAVVRELFWLATKFNFVLSAKHLPGKDNFVSDSLSRLHEPLAAATARLIITGNPFANLNCFSHMSYAAFCSLIQGPGCLTKMN